MEGKKKKSKQTLLIVLLLLFCIGGNCFGIYQLTKKKPKEMGYSLDATIFHKEKTPVVNMLLLVNILNSSNLCDATWFQEVEDFQQYLETQAIKYQTSSDAYISEMMKHQSQMAMDLGMMLEGKEEGVVEIEAIDALEESYLAYRNYYDQHYTMKGVDN